ncbi:V-set and immunoglobulin domain-containing protein 4-like isoform X2 [Rhea pennata]|uniref:V-set and immunoglobulin domain-containing protein 4-like isoform X2 n=1 Tax=Rhea pennata TaxID=8795 RepID=UPI002E2546B8
MEKMLQVLVLVKAFVSCSALLDLSGLHQINGTWKGSTTLPCTYVPSEGFTQQTLIWSMERDYSTSTIFRRDNSGDHVLLSQFRDRVTVPKNSSGDVTLQIKNLEIPDSGRYTCQVIWSSENNSLVTKEVTTTVKVVKVAVTKPIIRAGELGLIVPAGARTSLTCVASGSPPISYRWFLGEPGGKAQHLSSQAELTFESLQPSDSGKYYCEAENRVGRGVPQQSDAVELMVRDLPRTTVVFDSDVGTSERYHTTTDLPAATAASGNDAVSARPPIAAGLQRDSLPLYLIILVAGLCVATLVSIAVAIACRGKPRDGEQSNMQNPSMKLHCEHNFSSVMLRRL